MKTWQVLVLCFSIIISVAASAFYLKYEPKMLLASNYGPVDLGKVFSEKAMIDVTIIDRTGNAGGDKELITGASFYDKTKPVDKGLMKVADLYNIDKEEKDKLTYNKLRPIDSDTFKIEIRTYIDYSSSNFANMPYRLNISEETYRLSGAATLKESIDRYIESNFKDKKENVSNNLFITDKVAYGLEESASTK